MEMLIKQIEGFVKQAMQAQDKINVRGFFVVFVYYM